MLFGKTERHFPTLEKSTVGTTRSENWDRFPRICDLINTTQGGPRDAVRALKKRLSQNCNHKEIRLTLSWASHLTSRCLGYLICKMGISREPHVGRPDDPVSPPALRTVLRT
uniref:VHS domain-containing protein n=1 Tax=Ornithorhynchus anatinus TaxID=9258 RepID=A0A6I8NTT8_ORNAN